MNMKKGQEFIESLRRLKHEVYVLGERVENVTEHPILCPSLNALAKTYEMAHDPRYTELFVRQGLDGERVNCFTSLHHNTQDLLNKVKALRILGQETGTCFQPDSQGTQYHGRFLDYMRYVQQNDLVCNGAMTDVKGNRGLRPSQQTDPDMFLHVVERRPDGIVVRGAKAHQTGAVFSHEIIVMPTLRGSHSHPGPPVLRHAETGRLTPGRG